MPEPLLTALIGLLANAVGPVLMNIAANRLDRHFIDGVFLDPHIHDEIRTSLHKAWKEASNQLFQVYRGSPEYPELSPGVRRLVDARADLFVQTVTVEKLFPKLDNSATFLTAKDASRLFTASHHDVNQQLIDELERQGLWDGLPGKLQTILENLLLAGLLFHFVEFAIKRNPRARDTLLFQQLVALQRKAGATEAELATLQADLQTGLEHLEEYQQWTREVTIALQRIETIGERTERKVDELHLALKSQKVATASDWEMLYQPPEMIFQEVQIEEFTGREWLTVKVNRFLQEQVRRSGVFLLSGEAGVGKTAFLAHLVQNYGYLHIFARQFPGEANVIEAIKSLAAQLILRYNLVDYARRDLIEQLARTPTFIFTLLNNAARQLPDGEKIVVVCDGLDEAGLGPNGNPFGLPPTLPDNVYFIGAQRPDSIPLEFKADLHIEQLEAKSEDNQRDIEMYLRRVARKPSIAAQLVEHGYQELDFVRALAERSAGLWIYLRYVIAEIEQKEREPLDLARLPDGLIGYYAEYWGDWRDGRRGRGKGRLKWQETYFPLLTTLAVAQDPVDVNVLASWAGLSIDEAEELLRERWPAFISQRQIPGERASYGLYHASLRDFLNGKVEDANLLPAQKHLVAELEQANADAHSRIVEYYRAQCNSTWPRLARDDYSRRNLCLHLAGARRFEEMLKLVIGSNAWAKARNARERGYGGYLNDLELTWRWTESERGWDIGQQIRCALILSSINSIAGNISSELLHRLLISKVLKPTEALDIVRQMPNDNARVDAISTLAEFLPDRLLFDAINAAKDVSDEYLRGEALLSLLDYHSSDEILSEVEAAADEIKDEFVRDGIRDSVRQRTLMSRAERKAEKEYYRHEYRPMGGPEKIALRLQAKTELKQAQLIHDEPIRVFALAELASHVPSPALEELTDVCVGIIAQMDDRWIRCRSLDLLVSQLPAGEYKLGVIKKALDITAELLGSKQASDQAEAAVLLSRLTEFLPDGQRVQEWTVALDSVLAIDDDTLLTSALGRIHLPDWLPADALLRVLMLAGNLQNLPIQSLLPLDQHIATINHISASASILARVARNPKAKIKAEALKALLTIRDEDIRVLYLMNLADSLPFELQEEVRQHVLRIAVARRFVYMPIPSSPPLEVWLSAGWPIDDASEMLLSIQPQPLKAGLRSWWRRLLTGKMKVTRENVLQIKLWLLGTATVARRTIGGQKEPILDALGDEVAYLSTHLDTPRLAPGLVFLGMLSTSDLYNTRADASLLLEKALAKLPSTRRAELLDRMLGIIEGITDERERAPLLSVLAGLLPSRRLMGRALSISKNIVDPYEATYAHFWLASYLPDRSKAIEISSSLNQTRTIPDRTLRVNMLGSMADSLPEELFGIWLAIVGDIDTDIDDQQPEARTDLIAHLASTWTNPGRSGKKKFLKEWPPTLRRMARRHRRELIKDISKLAPTIVRISKIGAAREIYEAIRDITQWWP